jgi:hypothetical protein
MSGLGYINFSNQTSTLTDPHFGCLQDSFVPLRSTVGSTITANILVLRGGITDVSGPMIRDLLGID